MAVTSYPPPDWPVIDAWLAGQWGQWPHNSARDREREIPHARAQFGAVLRVVDDPA